MYFKKGVIINTKDTKSRKYLLTINNPIVHGLNHEAIKKALSNFSNIQYWCMCDEIGDNGTYHTHLYFYSPNAIKFSSVKLRLCDAHIDSARGSHKENRDYIRKEGKWRDTEKHETNLPNTFEESGELPAEREKRASVSETVIDMIEEGKSNSDIIKELPSMFSKIGHIEATRQTFLEEKYRDKWRELEVTYIWGESGVGKTRFVMEKYGYKDVYRVTDYIHPFDGYRGQDVVVFEEFRSSFTISDVLNYLDGYPVSLPCRYANKVACYTKVYIISNIPIEEQYRNIQIEQPETFKAFCRRIDRTLEFSRDSADNPFKGVEDA